LYHKRQARGNHDYRKYALCFKPRGSENYNFCNVPNYNFFLVFTVNMFILFYHETYKKYDIAISNITTI